MPITSRSLASTRRSRPSLSSPALISLASLSPSDLVSLCTRLATPFVPFLPWAPSLNTLLLMRGNCELSLLHFHSEVSFPLLIPNLNELCCRFRVPHGCDLVSAAALPVAFGTSHVALAHRARLGSGQVPIPIPGCISSQF